MHRLATGCSFIRSLGSVLPRLVDADTLTKQLNLQPETVHLAVKARAIPYYQFTASTIRFDLEEVRAFLQARLKEYELAKGKAPPPKNGAEVATSTRNHNAQRKIYCIGKGRSSRKFSGYAGWLIAELTAMGKALSDPRLPSLERRVIHNLRQATARKLRVLV